VRVIVGLGNPGADYEGSRHNAGFLVVAGLADGCGIKLSAGRGDFMMARCRLEGRHVLLVMPLTYMNASGHAVRQALDSAGATVDELVVVCDDVDLPLGQIRLRGSGSDGGHRGLRSIIAALGTDRFARLRLGVGRPPDGGDTADFVLDDFAEDEVPKAGEMIDRAVHAVRALLRDGIEKAMTIYNRRATPSDRGESQEE
jgi:peptidyl-tRNA hydrolase, PTH1 family